MKKTIIILQGLLPLLALLHACGHMERTHKDSGVETHQLQKQNKGTGMMYVDEVACNTMMRETDTAGSNTCFRCYVVGFVDSLSLVNTDKNNTETGKYYQYDMQYDWKAVLGGDSLRPVFFQTRQRLEGYRHEGVLIFETPKDKKPDVLLYTDTYGSWGTQQFNISNSQK